LRNCLYPVTIFLKKFSLLLSVNIKAQTAIMRLMKKDPIIKFMIKTRRANAAMGAEQ